MEAKTKNVPRRGRPMGLSENREEIKGNEGSPTIPANLHDIELYNHLLLSITMFWNTEWKCAWGCHPPTSSSPTSLIPPQLFLECCWHYWNSMAISLDLDNDTHGSFLGNEMARPACRYSLDLGDHATITPQVLRICWDFVGQFLSLHTHHSL